MSKRKPAPTTPELTPEQKRPGQVLEAVLDTIRDSGYLVIDLQGKIEIPEDVQTKLLDAIGIDALCDAVVSFSDNGDMAELADFIIRLKPERDIIESVCEKFDIPIVYCEIDPQHPVTIHATVAATSDNAFEIARALRDLRNALKDIKIYGRAQLDLMARGV